MQCVEEAAEGDGEVAERGKGSDKYIAEEVILEEIEIVMNDVNILITLFIIQVFTILRARSYITLLSRYARPLFTVLLSFTTSVPLPPTAALPLPPIAALPLPLPLTTAIL